MDVDTLLTDAVPLSVTHDSKALQLTAPSAKEKKGKAAIAVRILNRRIEEMRWDARRTQDVEAGL